MFDVNQSFSQKWSPKLSKPNFWSKTVGTKFALFVLHSTSFPINLITFVWRQSIIFSEMKPEALKSEVLLEDSEYNICCFFLLISTSQENCGVGIINGEIKCRLFVDKYLKTWLWVSYTFLQKPSLFNHFWIRPSFLRNFFVCKINDFGEINIWRFWWRRNVMRKKIHFLIK